MSLAVSRNFKRIFMSATSTDTDNMCILLDESNHLSAWISDALCVLEVRQHALRKQSRSRKVKRKEKLWELYRF